eukprot:scaffold99_cov160-Ochromonas_danica.AAC.14
MAMEEDVDLAKHFLLSSPLHQGRRLRIRHRDLSASTTCQEDFYQETHTNDRCGQHDSLTRQLEYPSRPRLRQCLAIRCHHPPPPPPLATGCSGMVWSMSAVAAAAVYVWEREFACQGPNTR